MSSGPSGPRVLLVAPFDGKTAAYVHAALVELGCYVGPFDYRREAAVGGVPRMNARLREAAAGANLVLVLKGELVNPNTVAGLGNVAVWNFDPRDGNEAWVNDLARSCAHFFTIAEGLVPVFRERGVNAHWLQEGASPKHHHPVGDGVHTTMLGFVGTVEGVPGRAEWLARLAQEFPGMVDVWGSFPGKLPVGLNHHGRAEPDEEFCRVVSNTFVNLGRDRNPEIKRSYGARLYRTLACGGFLLTNQTRGFAGDFDGLALTYRDDEECIDMVHWASDHVEECARMAKRGREEVLAHHTFKDRLKELLEVVGA